MKDDKLEIDVRLQIRRPVEDVFEAIVDPEKMSNYFISESSGRMKSDTKIEWSFPEFEESFPVQVKEIREPEFISFLWDDEGNELRVAISLASANGDTIVRITEGKRKNDEAGISWLKRSTEGWANFLACLKAYLEYGINLRKGGFDFMVK